MTERTETADDWRDKYHPRYHPPECGYHIDQYPFECDCGALRPKDQNERHLPDPA